MKRVERKIRALIASVVLCLGVGTVSIATASSAQAWPWDPHVRVWFNANACAGASGQWGWYSTGDGESGWVHWNAGYQGFFDLWRVPPSGSVTSIKWGTPGRTCDTRYFNIRRPAYGTIDALGWIG